MERKRTIDGLLITVGGDAKIVSIDTDNFLDDLYRLTNSTIVQALALPCYGQTSMWIDEEGKINGRQGLNLVATGVFRRCYRGDFIMGDVVLLGGADDEGYTLGIEKSALTKLRREGMMIEDARKEAA